METLGKFVLILGVFLVLLGAFIYLGGRLHIFGYLPGDFVIKKKNVVVIFPLASCLLFSLVLTLAFLLLRNLRR